MGSAGVQFYETDGLSDWVLEHRPIRIISCLDLRDPHGNTASFHETGLDESLQRKLLNQGGLRNIIDTGIESLSAGVSVLFMCRRGFHRSVGAACFLTKLAVGAGIEVDTRHWSLHHHADRFSRNTRRQQETLKSAEEVRFSID